MKKPAQAYRMPDPASVLTDAVIMAHIAAGSRVVDLGCGDGRLLEKLREKHGCQVLGVEVDQRRVCTAIGRGVPVIQADLDLGLPEVPHQSFDVAILSQTLQQVRHPKQVLVEMMRIAARALVVVPNFAFWRARLQFFFHGRAPITRMLPYQWYDTPNLHVMSMRDFRELLAEMKLRIVRELPIIRNRAVDRAWLANVRAESAMYILERERPTPRIDPSDSSAEVLSPADHEQPTSLGL